MLLTITTTHNPATNLGYLLHKNPGRAQPFELSFGKAHVFYPEASEARCTAALREFALGVDGLERFVRREPLRRVHECVFGVLALESEPVDPRL
jgi:hypothetical protein